MRKIACVIIILLNLVYAKDEIKPYKEMYQDGKTIKEEGSKKLARTTSKANGDNFFEIQVGTKKTYYPNGKIERIEEYDNYGEVISTKQYSIKGSMQYENTPFGSKRYDENGALSEESIYKYHKDSEYNITQVKQYENGKLKTKKIVSGINGFRAIVHIEYALDGSIYFKYATDYKYNLVMAISEYYVECDKKLAYELKNSYGYSDLEQCLENNVTHIWMKAQNNSYNEPTKPLDSTLSHLIKKVKIEQKTKDILKKQKDEDAPKEISVCDITYKKDSTIIESIKNCRKEISTKWVNDNTFEKYAYENNKPILRERIIKDKKGATKEIYAKDGNLLEKFIEQYIDGYNILTFERKIDNEENVGENKVAIIESTFSTNSHYRNIYDRNKTMETKYICDITKKDNVIESIKNCVKDSNISYEGKQETKETYAKDGSLLTKISTDSGIKTFEREIHRPDEDSKKIYVVETQYDKNKLSNDRINGEDVKVPLTIETTSFACDVNVDKDSNKIDSIKNCIKTHEGKFVKDKVWEEYDIINNKNILRKRIDDNKWHANRLTYFANDGSKSPCGSISNYNNDRLVDDVGMDEETTLQIKIYEDDVEPRCEFESGVVGHSCDFVFKKDKGLESIKNCTPLNSYQ